jgi:hypothetical protein
MVKRIVKDDGTVEIVDDKQSKGAHRITPENAPTEIQTETPTPTPQTRATGGSQGLTHFQKLEAAGSEAEQALTFTTEEQLQKYTTDCRTINNMQVKDPIRHQAEHGNFPRRGDTTIDKRGLTSQDQDDVLAARKKLEGPDDDGNFKAVPIK